MPELPEVERGRRLAESVAAGQRIAAVACAPDPIVYAGTPPAEWAELRGRRVLAARRCGKQLWFDLDAPPHPLFHFGMSGGFHVPGDTPLKLATGPVHRPDEWPPRYWKVRFTFDDGGELVTGVGLGGIINFLLATLFVYRRHRAPGPGPSAEPAAPEPAGSPDRRWHARRSNGGAATGWPRPAGPGSNRRRLPPYPIHASPILPSPILPSPILPSPALPSPALQPGSPVRSRGGADSLSWSWGC